MSERQLYEYQGQKYDLPAGLSKEEALEKINKYLDSTTIDTASDVEDPTKNRIQGDIQPKVSGDFYEEDYEVFGKDVDGILGAANKVAKGFVKGSEEEKNFFTSVYSEKLPFAKSIGLSTAEKRLKGGLVGGASSFYRTLANVPYLLLSADQKARAELGMPVSEIRNKSQLQLGTAYLYDALKETSNRYERYYNEIGKAQTIPEQVYEGLGMAFPVFTEYLMGLRALKGLPQKYKFPLSFGAIDALRQADEGPVESAKAFAQGATIGKYIEWAGPLAPVSRVTSTGALGFALPAEDVGSRISNAIIFGGTSIFPLGGRQTILDRKISDTVRNNRQQKAIVQFEKQFNEGSSAINKVAEDFNLLQKEKQKLEKEKKDTLEIEKQLDSKRTELYTLGKLLGQDMTVASRVRQERIDVTPPDEFRFQVVKMSSDDKMISRAVPQMSKKNVFQYIEREALTPSFAAKRFPVAKKGLDILNLHRIENESMIRMFLEDPQYAKITDKSTALALSKPGIGKEAMLYHYYKLNKKQKEELIDAVFAIEFDSAVLRSKKDDKLTYSDVYKGRNLDDVKKELKPFFDETTGEVNPKALTTRYKLSDDQGLAYLNIRHTITKSREWYNNKAKKAGRGIYEEIPNIPNYIPHIWLGDYRVYVSKKRQDRMENVEILPANTIFSANKIKKEIKEKDPTANVDVRDVSSSYQNQNMSIKYFSEATRWTQLKGSESEAIRTVYDSLMAKQGMSIFGATKLKRKQDFMKGFAGSLKGKKQADNFETALNSYIEGLVLAGNRIQLSKDLNDLFTKPLVNGPAFTRKTYEGVRPDSNITISKLFPNDADYVLRQADLVAFNNVKSPVTNWFVDNLSEWSKSNLSKGQIQSAFGGINQVAAQFYLFTYNIRFGLAQLIQPYMMIPTKLHHLRDLFGARFVDPYAATMDAMKNLARPDAFSQKVLQKAQDRFALNDIFMREFAGKSLVDKQRIANKGSVFKRVLYKLSGREIVGRTEQVSRMTATLMFAHMMRRAGIKEKVIIDNAWSFSDNYMVRYDTFDQPRMYGENFLGILGKPLGLFKTFPANFNSQLIEYIRNMKRYGDVSGFAHFVASNVIFAGALGLVGISFADAFIKNVINKGLDLNWPTATQLLMSLDLPDVVKYGVPSTAIQTDLTSTISAPGLAPGDFISAPGYDLAYDIANGVNEIAFRYLLNLGVLKAEEKILSYYGSDTVPQPRMGIPPSKGELLDAFKALTPKAFHGGLEQIWQGDDPMFRNKGKARLQREWHDWASRYLSSYSLREAKIIKTTFQLNLINKGRELTYDNLIDYAISETYILPPALTPSPWIFEMAEEMGYSDEQVVTSMKRRMKNRDRDLIDNVLKGDVMGPNRKLKQNELKFILDNIDAKEMKNDFEIIPEDIDDKDLR